MSDEEIKRIAAEIVSPFHLEVEVFPDDIRSVGSGGDHRTYMKVVNLIGPFPGHDEWAQLSTAITNNALVNRVTFQLAVRQ